MSASEAGALYAILSIGDGLVSQIPALLISVTAGIIVTRVPGEHRHNLARELTDQLAAQPQSLMVAAVVLVLFGLIPGFPMHYFILLAAMSGTAAWWVRRRAREGSTGAGGASADGGAGGTSWPPRRATVASSRRQRVGECVDKYIRRRGIAWHTDRRIT